MEYNFVEVIEQFDKMCRRLGQMHCDPKECPISALIDLWERTHEKRWDDHCLNFAREMPAQFAKEVMKWAKSHDEPIYPTTQDIINKIRMFMNVNESTITYKEFLNMPLNKTAADYFGIGPINKDKLV